MFGKKKTQLYPGCIAERTPPVNLHGPLVPGFFQTVNRQFDPVSLFHYTHVNLTPEGIVFRNLKKDPDLLIYPGHTKKYNFLYLASTLVKRKKTIMPPEEKYLLCFDYWSNSIFHWMCDALPRLESVKDLAKDCVLLLPEFYTVPYVLETLAAFQFKDIYRIKDSEYLCCKELYAPEQISTSGRIRPDNILSLRQSLLQHFKPRFSGKPSSPNIYISRGKARFRKVLNEPELLPILKKYGFEVVYFEDLSVSGQIELCYHADNIVSIHGANLTNIIFMPAHKNVLELRKRGDTANNYYYELTDSVNCHYYYLDCEFEDPEPHKNTFSLYVDVNQFDQALETLTHVS